MALVNCPECNHQVSDKAISCPNCGFPIAETIKQENVNTNTNNDFDNKRYCLLFKRLGTSNKIEVIKEVRQLLNMGLSEAKNIVDNAPSILAQDVSLETAKNIQNKLDLLNVVTAIEQYHTKEESFSFEKEQEIKQILDKHKEDVVRCPRCGSSAVTTGQRGFSLFTGFLGSNKTVNRCGNCGYSWQPK